MRTISNQRKNNFSRYYKQYTIAFILLYAVLYLIFKGNGKGFLLEYEGAEKQFPALYYIGEYFKNVVKDILSIGTVKPGMFDFRLGQGQDVFSTLYYYGLFDPLNVVTLVVSQNHMEGFYTALILIRLYLAGAAFSYFAGKVLKKETGAVVIGALVYTFSGFTLLIGIQSGVILSAMIYLPLLLVALERILKKKKCGCFTVMVCLSFITSYEYALVNTVLVAIYLVVRVVGRELGTAKEKGMTMVKVVGAYFWGLAMSAVVLLPVLYTYVTSYMASRSSEGHWMALSLPAICIVSILFLFIRREKEEQRQYMVMRLGVVLTLAVGVILLVGKYQAGFSTSISYISYGLAFVSAIITVVVLPKVIFLTKQEENWLLSIVGVVVIIGIFLTKGREWSVLVLAGFLVITTSIIASMARKNSLSRKRRYLVVTILTLMAILVQMMGIYTPKYENYVSQFLDAGQARKTQKESPVQAMDMIKDSTFYRVEQSESKGNQAQVLHYKGNSFDLASVSKGISNYYEEVGLASLGQTNQCDGQQGRTVLNALSSTKYYVTDSKGRGLVPFGYEMSSSKERADGTLDYVYENKYALGIAYSYENFMRKSEFDKLSPLEKQEVMMSCAVIADDQVPDTLRDTGKEVTSDQIKFNTNEIYSRIGTLDGVIIEKQSNDQTVIKVNKKNATMQITYNGREDSETYLMLKNLSVIEGAEKNEITVSCKNSVSTSFSLYSKNSPFYEDKEYFGVNLGSDEDSKDSLTITFPEEGTFSFESLKMYSYSLKDYTAQVLALKDGGLQDVAITGNGISGIADLAHDGWMQFSIPYSKGWTVFVDGKKQELTASNIGYIGIYLEKGTHKVLLTYQTPYLTAGFAITLVAVAGLGISVFLRKRNEEKE